MDKKKITEILSDDDPEAVRRLSSEADRTRKKNTGDTVHLRAIIEISNHCRRNCLYCGMNRDNLRLERYRVPESDILGAARMAAGMGFDTAVIQSGEDPGLSRGYISRLVSKIIASTGLAVTLSLGERSFEDFKEWKKAGAARYLLKFETSDDALYSYIHPPAEEVKRTRMEMLAELKLLGYEVGSGVMAGLPGQTVESMADDLLAFRNLDLDMISISPYIPHNKTVLGKRWKDAPTDGDRMQKLVIKMTALARLLCPRANIPATTALSVLRPGTGKVLALSAGANVVMQNFTPEPYIYLYDIYEGKTARPPWNEELHREFLNFLASMGRTLQSRKC